MQGEADESEVGEDGTGRLAGKVAIVTGAARGTGAAVAELFVQEGASVLLADILDERGGEVAEALGARAAFIHLDVTEESDWTAALASVEKRFGSPHILVNNAAILDVSAFTQTRPETFERIFRVNQLGPFLGMQAVFESMKRHGGGSIVNVASIDALEGNNGVAAYTSSKWGLRGLTKAVAMEFGQYDIRVNTVCPNPGSREMVEPFLQEAVERLREREERLPDRPIHPFARRGEISDVARAILFLASDESAFISGIDLPVDGGWTAGKIEPGAPRA